jgi:hypothetical protein
MGLGGAATAKPKRVVERSDAFIEDDPRQLRSGADD